MVSIDEQGIDLTIQVWIKCIRIFKSLKTLNTFIIISFLFIVGYYVYLPWLKNKKGTLKIVEAEKVLPENFANFEFYKIKKISEIILESYYSDSSFKFFVPIWFIMS